MSAFVLRGGRLVDPIRSINEVGDLFIEDGMIRDAPVPHAQDIDVSGLVVAPGFVDMHTHVREPGREDEETILTASRAAAAGGYTALCAMPNTSPVADSATIVEKVWALGREAGLVDVVPAGSLSKGLEGIQMSDIGEMVRSPAAIRLFTDDGRGVQDALFVRRVMEYLVGFDAVYAEHCEDASLAAGGEMHEGERSVALGLRGIPAVAEELMAARDIALSRLTGCRLHLLHISTRGTVELVRRAKADGIRVTAEATPHHFTLTDAALDGYDPMAKVSPPLRSAEDRAAIVEGLADGTIDAIATDHAPHAREEKDQEFSYAPPGLVGLETALGLTLTQLVEPEHLSLATAVERLSCGPARILGLEGQGSLEPGTPAHVVAFDPGAEWVVDPESFQSKSRNTPFAGRTLRGRVMHTFFAGVPTVERGMVVEGVRA